MRLAQRGGVSRVSITTCTPDVSAACTCVPVQLPRWPFRTTVIVWWIETSQVGHLLYHVEVNAISLLSGVDKSTHIKDFVQGVGAVSRVALYTEAAQATYHHWREGIWLHMIALGQKWSMWCTWWLPQAVEGAL